jgi:hypothetical protein
LIRVDPVGVEGRFCHRRVYNVQSPNALWHIDGFHKLIRWHIVIHGGIDGFSRLIVYLNASSNNRAETVLQHFSKAINEYGLPSRVRSDMRGENVLVAQFMLRHPQRGPNRGSMTTGRLIHNQRIERLWSDLFAECVSHFYYLFYVMEDVGILNPESELDLCLLQLLYIPEINRQLEIFRCGWNSHKIHTARNKSPIQLWISGLYDSYGTLSAAADVILDDVSSCLYTFTC